VFLLLLLNTHTVILAFVCFTASFLIVHSLPLALAIAAMSRPTLLPCQLEKSKFQGHHSTKFAPKYVNIDQFTVAVVALINTPDSDFWAFFTFVDDQDHAGVPKPPSLFGFPNLNCTSSRPYPTCAHLQGNLWFYLFIGIETSEQWLHKICWIYWNCSKFLLWQ
jgi:hypothetical protein